jgi:hypothetical protein
MCAPLACAHSRAASRSLGVCCDPTAALRPQHQCCRVSTWLSLLLTALVSAATTASVAVLAFWRADADLNLWLRPRHKRDAFAGKVVWVTGASQVRADGAACGWWQRRDAIHACLLLRLAHRGGCCTSSGRRKARRRPCVPMPVMCALARMALVRLRRAWVLSWRGTSRATAPSSFFQPGMWPTCRCVVVGVGDGGGAGTGALAAQLCSARLLQQDRLIDALCVNALNPRALCLGMLRCCRRGRRRCAAGPRTCCCCRLT